MRATADDGVRGSRPGSFEAVFRHINSTPGVVERSEARHGASQPARMSGEEKEDRKRKGSEPDATAVAPKKKFLAAHAQAAAQDGAGGGGKVDWPTTSYSIKDNAPSGALNAESEEIIKFQNKQLYAAIEVPPPPPPAPVNFLAGQRLTGACSCIFYRAIRRGGAPLFS